MNDIRSAETIKCVAVRVGMRDMDGLDIFTVEHIIDVLRRKATEKVAKFGHERLTTFGIGADWPEAEWRLLLRRLVALHIVEVDHTTCNVLRLTGASRAVLRGERWIELRLAQAAPKKSKRKAAVPITADKPLFEKLRAWRAAVAKEHGLPAYVVFYDGTLHAIAQARPVELEELRRFSEVGEKKVASYGEALSELVRANSE